MTRESVKGTLQAWALPILEAEIEKLNKRAAKCKVQPLVLNVLERYVKHAGKDEFGSDKFIEFADVEIIGECPRINGWQLVAKITPLEGTNQNLVKTVPGLEGDLDEKYRTVGTSRCDHCNTSRRRNDVFVLRHEDGREQVVGRNCLADFVRTENFEGMIEYADWVSDCQEMLNEDYDWEPMGRGVRAASEIKHFLETTSICIRKLGWVSRSQGGQATADLVCWFHWVPDTRGEQKKLRNKHDLYTTEFDKELAVKALEWVRDIEPKGDYLHNLKLACSRDWVDHETAGIVASLVPAYQRAMEQEVKRAKLRKAAALREYVGEEGKRMRGLKLTCIGISSFESMYGVKTFLRFLDEDENLIVWSASGDKTEDFDHGHVYVVDATVKKHEDHETFGRQTFVNRLKVKEELGAQTEQLENAA